MTLSYSSDRIWLAYGLCSMDLNSILECKLSYWQFQFKFSDYNLKFVLKSNWTYIVGDHHRIAVARRAWTCRDAGYFWFRVRQTANTVWGDYTSASINCPAWGLTSRNFYTICLHYTNGLDRMSFVYDFYIAWNPCNIFLFLNHDSSSSSVPGRKLSHPLWFYYFSPAGTPSPFFSIIRYRTRSCLKRSSYRTSHSRPDPAEIKP